MREYADGTRAAEIARVDTLCNSVVVRTEDGGERIFPGCVNLFLGRHWPQPGDYLVEDDGGGRCIVPRSTFLATHPGEAVRA